MESSNASALVLSLHGEGLSLQQIADELGINKSSVYRIVKNAKNAGSDDEDLSSVTLSPQRKEEIKTSQLELAQLKLELEHEVKMKELELRQFELERMPKIQQPINPIPNTIGSSNQESKKNQKASMLLQRYHALVNLLTKLLNANEWDEDECHSFKSKAERLLSAIEKYAEDLALDPEDLVVVDNLGFIIDLVANTIEAEDLDEDGFLTFNLEEDDWESVEALSELDELDEAFGE